MELTLRIALCGFFNRFNQALPIGEDATAVHPVSTIFPNSTPVRMSDSLSLQRRALLRATGAGVAALALPAFSHAQESGPIRIRRLCPLSGGGGAYGAGMANARAQGRRLHPTARLVACWAGARSRS